MNTALMIAVAFAGAFAAGSLWREAVWRWSIGATLSQVRHRALPVPSAIRRGIGLAASSRWTVETDDPVWAAAPGQACVLYAGDEVLGGGRIARL